MVFYSNGDKQNIKLTIEIELITVKSLTVITAIIMPISSIY